MLDRYLLMAVFGMICLAGQVCAGDAPATLDELKSVVKEYAFKDKPGLRADTEFKIEEYTIDGTRGMKVQIILARYISPRGTQFAEGLFVYHDGKLTPFGATFGGHGLMSGVIWDGKLYYTYSFGSGEHRSHLGQMAIVNGEVVLAASGPVVGEDLFVKKVGDSVQVEKGDFDRFNQWQGGESIGTIKANESGFMVQNAAKEEIGKLAGKPVVQKGAGK